VVNIGLAFITPASSLTLAASNVAARPSTEATVVVDPVVVDPVVVATIGSVKCLEVSIVCLSFMPLDAALLLLVVMMILLLVVCT